MAITRQTLKETKQLAQKKFRAEREEFVIEGLRLLEEAANSSYEIVRVLHAPEFGAQPSAKALLQKLHKKTPHIEEVTERELASIAETVTAQGIVAVLKTRPQGVDDLLRQADTPSVLVAFDAVSDPGNVGSMIRTCDWFGVQGILISRNSVELYNPKVLRSTMGSVFHLPIAEDVDLLSTVSRAKGMGYKVYVTDAAGEIHADRAKFSNKSLIIFGNEAWGVSDQLKQLADVRLAIRRYGMAESLNVGVACGIVLSGLHKLLDE